MDLRAHLLRGATPLVAATALVVGCGGKLTGQGAPSGGGAPSAGGAPSGAGNSGGIAAPGEGSVGSTPNAAATCESAAHAICDRMTSCGATYMSLSSCGVGVDWTSVAGCITQFTQACASGAAATPDIPVINDPAACMSALTSCEGQASVISASCVTCVSLEVDAG